MVDEPLTCVPVSFKTIAAQTIHQRLKKYKMLLEDEVAKDDRDEEWIDERVRIIQDTQETLDFINEMPTCDG